MQRAAGPLLDERDEELAAEICGGREDQRQKPEYARQTQGCCCLWQVRTLDQ